MCDLSMSASVSKQGLLRVAIENARAQEKQDQLERTELKMELVRERELRETLERQLSVEQKNRGRDPHQRKERELPLTRAGHAFPSENVGFYLSLILFLFHKWAFLNLKPLCDSVLIQKRLKKEKRNKRRLQEALEEEVKLRDQAEHTLLHTASTHTGAHAANTLPNTLFHTCVQQTLPNEPSS